MKKVLAMVLALAMVFALCACGNGGNNGGDSANNGDTENKNNEQAKDFYTDQIDVNGIDAQGKKIVYIAPSLDIEYWQWVEDGVRQACEEYGVSVEVYVSNNSAADQAENGETAVIQGADAVVLSPVSSDSCSTVLDACEDAGIPVTIAAIGSTADNYYAFISADDYTSGYDAGIYLCDQAKALGGDSIGVLALPMDRSNAKAKMAGLEKACEEKGITIAQTIQTSNLTVSESTDMCSDLLTANPDIKGIYCMYEQAGIAAIDVVDNMGVTGKISIVSSDGSPDARAVEKLGGEIVGAFDVSENALKSFKKEFYCDVISYEQIPEYVEKADYAVISTPPTKRLDYVEMVLSKHVPLYLEKPIATTLEDAEKIVAMAKQYDAKIIVGFAHRFRPAFVKMYDMVKSGMFGDPVNVFSYRVGAGFGYGKNNAMYGNSWRTDPKLACGMTIESVSHEFNLLTSLAGEFDTIACNVKGTISNVPQFDTNSTMVMRCKNGAVASIMTSWSSGAGANLKGYIGTNGSILLRGRNMFEFDSITYKTVDMDHEESITFNDSYDLNKDEVIYHVHVYFQDCLKNNKPVEIGGLSEGMKVLKLSNAALESAKEQKTIALGDYYTL